MFKRDMKNQLHGSYNYSMNMVETEKEIADTNVRVKITTS